MTPVRFWIDFSRTLDYLVGFLLQNFGASVGGCLSGGGGHGIKKSGVLRPVVAVKAR